jgi:hypothetical protein
VDTVKKMGSFRMNKKIYTGNQMPADWEVTGKNGAMPDPESMH